MSKKIPDLPPLPELEQAILDALMLLRIAQVEGTDVTLTRFADSVRTVYAVLSREAKA